MKLLIISYEEYPFYIGLNSRIDGLINSLTKKNIKIKLIVPSFKNLNNYKINYNINIIRIKLLNLFRINIPIISRVIFVIIYNLFVLKNVIKLKFDFDIIQSQQIYPALSCIIIGKIYNKKIIIDDPTMLCLFIDDKISNKFIKILLYKFINLFEYIVYSNVDFILCSSKKTIEYIKNLNKKFDDKLYYLPNGVDTTIFYPVKNNEWNNKLFFNCSLPFYQNIASLKNLFKIIKYIDQNKSYIYSLTIVVNNEKFIPKDILKYIQKSSHIRLLSAVTNIATYIQEADIALMPYEKGHYLTAGARLKALEYLACGNIVISTPEGVDGIDGLENGKNIIICEDINHIINTIYDIYKHKYILSDIKNNAYNLIINNYTWDKLICVYDNIIN